VLKLISGAADGPYARHPEELGTSTLCNVFPLIAMGVMVLVMFSSAAAAGDPLAPQPPEHISIQYILFYC
jgi:hypothetical protein